MNPIIKIFPDLNQLTDFLISRISEQILNKKPGQYYSIALSGGSTPKAIFQIISENHRNKIDWRKVLIFWGDERCVPSTDPESNYRMTHENLFRNLHSYELNFCRIIGENDPEEEAKRYSEKAKTMLPNINNVPQFDLIMLGLGEDGHTASIFPYNIELFNSDQLFETSKHPVSKQIRITATGKLINNAKEICFLVTGSGKAEKVAQVIQKKEGWEALPASMVHPVEGQVFWLLDEEAAILYRDKPS